MFVSPVPDSLALETDALSMVGKASCLRLPPTPDPSSCASQFQETAVCRLLLVAPLWPKQLWFPLLQHLAVEPPLELPLWERLLSQPLSDVYHQDPALLQLHAWLLVKEP